MLYFRVISKEGFPKEDTSYIYLSVPSLNGSMWDVSLQLTGSLVVVLTPEREGSVVMTHGLSCPHSMWELSDLIKVGTCNSNH